MVTQIGTRPLLTIAIPSFNRPEELARLLASIDTQSKDVEVLVGEDCAPRRTEVRAVVRDYSTRSSLTLVYNENVENLGFDGNVRHLVEIARGRWILFMGDDDVFVQGRLDKFIELVASLKDEKYILRSYQVEHNRGRIEAFHYLPESCRIAAGEESVGWLFKRSVTLSGFCIERDAALEHSTHALDGTLLYQVYMMAMVCLTHPSFYCDLVVAQMTPTYRGDVQMFGSSAVESSKFTPGMVTPGNSLNFTRSYFEVAGYIDACRGTQLTKRVRIEVSKYSYPFLSIQRKRGLRVFLQYAGRLESEAGLAITPYFRFYKWALALLGERACDFFIGAAKRVFGHTPNL